MDKFRRKVQINGPLTVGYSDTGYDVTLYSATAGCNLLWDESTDELDISATTEIQAAHKLQFRDNAIYINSTADAGLNLVADGTITLAAASVIVTGQLSVSGSTVNTGSQLFSSTACFAEQIAVAGSTSLVGPVTVGGSSVLSSTACLSENLAVGGSATIVGATVITGDTTLSGSSTLSSTACIVKNLAVGGSTSLVGPVTIAGSSVLSSTACVTGNVAVTGSMSVSSSANVVGELNVTASANFTDVVAIGNDLAVTGSLTVSTSANLADELNVTASALFTGCANFLDAVGITKNIDVTGSANFQNDVAVTGSLTVSTSANMAAELNVTGSANFAASVAFADEVTVAKDLKVTGCTVVGDGGATNYATFAADGELTLLGTARIIKTHWIQPRDIRANISKNWAAGSNANASTFAWQFTSSGTEGSAQVGLDVPSDMDTTATGCVDVLWSAGCVAAANASMAITVAYYGIGEGGTPDPETLLTGVEGSGTGGASAFEWTNVTAALTAPAASTKHMTIRLTYAPNTAQTSAGSTFQLNGMTLKYISNKLGTAT